MDSTPILATPFHRGKQSPTLTRLLTVVFSCRRGKKKALSTHRKSFISGVSTLLIRSIFCPCFSLPLTAWWKATKNYFLATSVKDGNKLASCSLLFNYFSIERRMQQRLSLTKMLWNVTHFLSRGGGDLGEGHMVFRENGRNLVVSSRVQRRHYEKLNANERGN